MLQAVDDKQITPPPQVTRGFSAWFISLRRGCCSITTDFKSSLVETWDTCWNMDTLLSFPALTSSSSTHCVPSVKPKPSATISTYGCRCRCQGRAPRAMNDISSYPSARGDTKSLGKLCCFGRNRIFLTPTHSRVPALILTPEIG